MKTQSVIHYFTEHQHIKVGGGKAKYSIIIKVSCGAKTGEADNRIKCVTCDKCKQIMK